LYYCLYYCLFILRVFLLNLRYFLCYHVMVNKVVYNMSTYLPVHDQPTARVTSQNDYDFFLPRGSRRSKGVPSGSAVFLQLLVGELGTPKLAQSFAYGKWLYPYRILLHGTSDLDQRCLKTHNSKDGCTFPPSPLPQKSPQNPILRDLLVQTLLL